jgi:hypothetical protein
MNNQPQTMSMRETIAREIQSALCGGAEMTTAALAERCPSAVDKTDVSRTLYDLRHSGHVETAKTVASDKQGRGARLVNTYRWRDDADRPFEFSRRITAPAAAGLPHQQPPAPTSVSALPEPLEPSEPDPLEKAAMLNGTWTEDFNLADAIAADIRANGYPDSEDDAPIDLTRRMIVAELVDHIDTAVLEYADAALASDPVWNQLRTLQMGAVSAMRQATDREDRA